MYVEFGVEEVSRKVICGISQECQENKKQRNNRRRQNRLKAFKNPQDSAVQLQYGQVCQNTGMNRGN